MRAPLLAMLLGAGACTPTRPEAPPVLEIDEDDMGAQLEREPIRFELDVPYASSNDPRQRLDIYLPRAPRSDALPVIVFVHGGWMHGDKAEGAPRLLPYVRGGEYAGVSVGYRVAGQATWPARLHDVKAAIRWIRAHASAYGLDRNRIVAYGHGTGGELALLLGATGDKPELEGELGRDTAMSTAVAGVVNVSGVTDIPTQWISRDDPPVLTLHGTEDRIVAHDHAVRLHRALAAAGVRNWLVSVEGADHVEFPAAADARVEQFLASILLGRDVVVSSDPLSAGRPLAREQRSAD
jgi:acetyl esterase/lipase